MGANSGISWTDHTFNPWWGCEKVSPACTHCYAETFSKRTGFDIWGSKSSRRFFKDPHWNEPIRWNKEAKDNNTTYRVFCASMADVFEDRLDLVFSRSRLFSLIDCTPNLNWLLLTKRPENIEPMWVKKSDGSIFRKNVWLGTTVENQEWATKRIPFLVKNRAFASVLFLSIEPLLGPISLNTIPGFESLDWVIIGGESGAKRTELSIADVSSIAGLCSKANIKVFVKQDSGLKPGLQGRLPDSLWIKELPLVV